MVYEGGAELKKSKKLSHGLWTAPKLNVKFDQVMHFFVLKMYENDEF